MNNEFPSEFLFGVSTSAYQIEGAWDEGGKSENFWDRKVHEKQSIIKDGSSGDVAADSYHKYKEDVSLIKSLGVDYYRFSLSWCRILPDGDYGNINREGINYYNSLINELLANNIQPMITIYHWDLPQILQDMGGWFNPLMANYFEDYARICFEEFGDRVKWWITFNDPTGQCEMYFSELAHGFCNLSGRGEYIIVHNMLISHAKAYRLYEKEFKCRQKGKVGITISCPYYEPKTPSREDKEAAEIVAQLKIGWLSHPIFSKSGDYPLVLKKIVDANSRKEGRTRSRLPVFTSEEIKNLRGSSDFFGINHYSTELVSNVQQTEKQFNCVTIDCNYKLCADPNWPKTGLPFMHVVPWGLRKALNWIKSEYGNPQVLITENGYGDNGEIEDKERVKYFGEYLNELLKAIHLDKCNVIGYTAWSLMDNFEWIFGYTVKFGLHHVDYENDNKTRTPRLSAEFFQEVSKTKRLPKIYKDVWKPSS